MFYRIQELRKKKQNVSSITRFFLLICMQMAGIKPAPAHHQRLLWKKKVNFYHKNYGEAKKDAYYIAYLKLKLLCSGKILQSLAPSLPFLCKWRLFRSISCLNCGFFQKSADCSQRGTTSQEQPARGKGQSAQDGNRRDTLFKVWQQKGYSL